MLPAREPCYHHQRKNILGRHFIVSYQITATLWHAHRITASGIMRMYSITLPQNHLNSTLQSHTMDNLLDYLLLFRLLYTMALQVQNQSAQTNAILDAITYSKGTQCDSVQL